MGKSGTQRVLIKTVTTARAVVYLMGCNTELTYSDNYECSGSVQYAQCNNAKYLPIEEKRHWKTEYNTKDSPECQPDGKGCQNEHKDDNQCQSYE